MNRSVINWMITGGVLVSGAVVAAAPAVANPVGSGPANGNDTAKTSGTDTAKRDDDRGAGKRPVRHQERSGAEKPDSGRDDDWPCCSRICRPGSDRRGSGGSGIGLLLAGLNTPQRPPVAAPRPAALPVLEVLPAVTAPIRSAPPAAVVEARPAPMVVVPVPAAPRGTTPPVASVPPLSRPISVAPVAPIPSSQPAPPARGLGYPVELPGADLGHVAALALPGLAAIAGMTALGGMLGYRQAKAGYVLRAAGAGRFLQ